MAKANISSEQYYISPDCPSIHLHSVHMASYGCYCVTSNSLVRMMVLEPRRRDLLSSPILSPYNTSITTNTYVYSSITQTSPVFNFCSISTTKNTDFVGGPTKFGPWVVRTCIPLTMTPQRTTLEFIKGLKSYSSYSRVKKWQPYNNMMGTGFLELSGCDLMAAKRCKSFS